MPSMVSQVFRPNVDAGRDIENVRSQLLGGIFAGNFNKVVSNKRAALVWEALGFCLTASF